MGPADQVPGSGGLAAEWRATVLRELNRLRDAVDSMKAEHRSDLNRIHDRIDEVRQTLETRIDNLLADYSSPSPSRRQQMRTMGQSAGVGSATAVLITFLVEVLRQWVGTGR